jgi:3'(2'), 5'-bisphosphate nucleotidase
MSSNPPLKDETEFALALAERCGVLAHALQRQGAEALNLRDKSDDQGPVTIADMEVNRLIVEAISERFPRDAILAEESAEVSERLERERCWFIDPVDGTKDFARGDRHWAIHIGLCINGHPSLGVVAEPARGTISWGINTPAHREGWSIETHEQTTGTRRALDPREARRHLVTSRSHHTDRVHEAAKLLGIGSDEHHRFGSVGCKAAALARGDARLYVHPVSGTKLWDSCAPHALLLGCGGQMTDVRGAALTYLDESIVNQRGLLATVGGVHDEIVERLAPLTTVWFP